MHGSAGPRFHLFRHGVFWTFVFSGGLEGGLRTAYCSRSMPLRHRAALRCLSRSFFFSLCVCTATLSRFSRSRLSMYVYMQSSCRVLLARSRGVCTVAKQATWSGISASRAGRHWAILGDRQGGHDVVVMRCHDSHQKMAREEQAGSE